MSTKITANSSYDEKFMSLNRNMRWEVAELLKAHYLSHVNAGQNDVFPKDSFYTRHVKRSIDVCVALMALLITAPLNIIGAIVTFFDVGLPLIFKQKRLGKDCELFTLYKFRNMRDEYDDNGHPLPGELRVTKLGNFARRTSLDELLNFWSVLRGEMSLIGPRPLVPEYQSRYSERHKMRMAVRPGIECPPCSRAHSVSSYHEQFENDIWYVENVSFVLDIKLAFRILGLVLNRRHSSRRGEARKGSFMGYDAAGQAIDSASIPVWAIDEVLMRHGILQQFTTEKLRDPVK